jgi:hypothetical protein
VTAGRGGLHGEVGHTCFQISKGHAAVVVHVSERTPHLRGGGGGGGGEGSTSSLQGSPDCLACVHCTLYKRALGICESCCERMCAARDKGAMCMVEGRAGALDSAGVDDRVSVRDEVVMHRDARRIPHPSLACANHPWSHIHTRSAGMKG